MTSRTGRVGGRRTGGRSAHGRGDGVTRSVVVAGFPIGFPVGLSCGGWVRGGPAAGFGGGGRVPAAGGPPGDRQERLQLLWGTVMTGYLWGNRARTDERSPERAHRDGAGRGVDAGGWAPRHAEGGNMTMDARGTTFPASTESVDAGVAGSAARCARPSAATTSPHRSCAGRSTAACSGRSGAVSSANEVSMSKAHRVSPPEGDGLPPSSSDVRARHTPETVRNVPSRGRTTRRRPLIWAVLTWALPPLSTGGGLGLPRPRSALPCHRPALRSRTVTAQVVSRFPLRAIGLRPMARLQAHSRWPDGSSRSGSTSSTGSRPPCPAAVAIGVRTPRARPVDPSPAPARGPPGPVPAGWRGRSSRPTGWQHRAPRQR